MSLLTVTSPAFTHGESIPAQYTCDGQGHSPALAWVNAPPETKSFVLLVHDPDAPAKDWIHWLVVNIPPTTVRVAENSSPIGGTTLLNDSGAAKYDDLCPPRGQHRYYFKIYALDIPHVSGGTRGEVETAMAGHILAQDELLGLYQRLAKAVN